MRFSRLGFSGKSFIFIVILFFLLPLGLAYGQADSGGGGRLAVIDMRDIIQRSNAMSTIRDALDEQNEAFQNEISGEELALRQVERELNASQSVLSEEAFAERLGAFEARVVAMQRSIQTQKLSFDRSIQQAQGQLEQELLQIVSEIAQERSLSMVLRRQNVVIYNNAFDITDEALLRLNERTKNITLTRQDGVVIGGN